MKFIEIFRETYKVRPKMGTCLVLAIVPFIFVLLALPFKTEDFVSGLMCGGLFSLSAYMVLNLKDLDKEDKLKVKKK